MKKSILLAASIIFAALNVPADNAKSLYDRECSKCHGIDGRGQTKMGKRLGAKDYTNPAVQAGLKNDAAFKATKEGLKSEDGKELMKPAEGLSDDDIKALVAYMRSFKP